MQREGGSRRESRSGSTRPGLVLVQTLRFQRKAPSQNDYRVDQWTGRGRWKYYRAKQSWFREIPPCPLPLAAMGRRRLVLFTRWMGHRERAYDEENFKGGCKPILDVLVKKGWLVDDRRKMVETEYRQWRAWNRRVGATLTPEMEIRIYDYEEG